MSELASKPARTKIWQFSLQSMVLVALIAGPIAGGLAGTFGTGVQGMLLLLATMSLLLVALSVVCVVVVFVILSPLFFVDTVLRSSEALPNLPELDGLDYEVDQASRNSPVQAALTSKPEV